jgi:RNA polymerase sigma-70 factor (ECF subfamily)
MEGPAAPDPIVSVDDRDALERAFARLSPEHRAVFVMHHYAGLPLATIAEVVGVPVGTVKSRLHKSIQNLRAALRSDGIVEMAEVRSA